MIKEVDEAILESLRKGLSDLVPSENIIIGDTDQKKDTSIFLIDTGFTVEEMSIGGSGGVKKEEIAEKFNSDGKKKDYTLSYKPLKPLISVENTVGNLKKEPDDYTVDYQKGIVSFRAPPEKRNETVQIKYNIARAVAETRNLKFVLAYSIYVRGENWQSRNQIMLEIIKLFYLERAKLADNGIEEMKLIRGDTTQKTEDRTFNEGIIEYQVETTFKIEIPLQPIERIEIGRMK
jgi:hypothetical protein